MLSSIKLCKFDVKVNGSSSHKTFKPSTMAVQTRQSSLSSALRTTKHKATVKNVKIDAETEWFVFPNNILGSHVGLNWMLNKYDVTPSNEAYRNLKHRSLLGRTTGKVDKTKAIMHTSSGKEFAYLQTGPTTDLAKNIVDETTMASLFKEAKRHLEDAQQLFVFDGSVGGHKAARVKIRVITEDPNAHLFMTHMIPLLPKSVLEPVERYEPDLVVYYVPSFKPEAPKLTDQGFTRFFPKEKALVAAGNYNNRSFLDALFSAASQTLLSNPESGIIPLVGDIATIGKNNVMVVSNNALLKHKIPVSGTHHAFWTSSGVVPAWDGVTSPVVGTLKRGDLVEATPDGASAHTTKLYTAPRVSASSVVFAVPDTQGILPTLSKLTPQQAAQHFAAGYTGKGFTPFFGNNLIGSTDPNIVVQAFKKFMESSNVPVYIMNTLYNGKELTSEDITKILTATADGSAASAPTGKNFTLLTPITTINGVSSNFAGDASKEKQIADQLKTAFPNVTF